MNEEVKLAQAKEAFQTLCCALDKHEWRYEKSEEQLGISCGAQGEDLPMKITIKVDAERLLVMLFSRMPFVVQEDKRLELAIAVSAINNMLVDGSFDYDVNSGSMLFRMTTSILESKLSEEVFSYMLFCSCNTIDVYNDKLLMLAKGLITIEKFLETIHK